MECADDCLLVRLKLLQLLTRGHGQIKMECADDCLLVRLKLLQLLTRICS